MPISIEEVMQLLPHRFPFLLVDKIVEMEPSVRITGLKLVTSDEEFLARGELGDVRMPDLLVVEALAQTGAVLLMHDRGAADAKLVYFAGLDHASWQGAVRPGDELRLEVIVTRARGRLCKVHGIARVGSAIVCEADLAAVLVDRDAHTIAPN